MGYTQSLRAEQMGLALQMDMAVTAFLEPGPVIDFLTRAAGLHNPHDFARATREQIRKADRAISTIKVRVEGWHAMDVACNLTRSVHASPEQYGHTLDYTHIPLLEESSLYAAGTTEGSVRQ